MKKPNRERLLYLAKIAERRLQKEAAKAAQKKRRRLRATRARKYAARTFRVYAPMEFNLEREDSRSEVIRFLDRTEYLLSQGARVQIRFDRTKKLIPTGTLLFVAMVDTLLDRYPAFISCNYPGDEVVEQLFQHIGLLEKLGNTPRKAVTADNVRFWKYIRGTSVELTEFKALFETFAGGLKGDVQAGLFEGMSEAVTNVIQHAYPPDADGSPAPESRWWMFAQNKEGKLNVAICDLGIGIPESLRRKPELRDVLPRMIWKFRRRLHNGLIEIAVESHRSRTRLIHRGKGLPDMLSFARGGDVGGFLIHSQRGSFAYNAIAKTEGGRDFPATIKGTLIHWELPLAS